MFSIKNIIWVLLTLLAVLVGGLKAYIDYQIQQQLDHASPSMGQMRYQNARLTWAGHLVIQQLQFKGENSPHIDIAQVVLHDAYRFYDIENTLPEQSHIKLSGVKIEVPDVASDAPVWLSSYKPYFLSWRELRQLGFPQFLMDVDVHISQQADTLDLEVQIQGQRWGAIHFTSILHNVPASPLNWAKHATQIQFERMVLTYDEQQLMQKITTFLARRLKQPENVFKPQLAYKLRRDIESLRTQLSVSSIDALDQFIQQPKTLQFSFLPTTPYPSYQTVLNTPPQQIVKSLGFEIK